MYQDWIAAKEGQIAIKVEARKQEITDFHTKLSGEAKTKAAPVASTEEE